MRIIIIIIIIVFGTKVFAQIGGDHSYSFLNLPYSAKDAALGSKVVSDVSALDLYIANNPALLSNDLLDKIFISYTSYYADIRYGNVGYVFKDSKIGVFAGGLTYINYGSFIEADKSGTITGDFTAADYSFNVSWSYQLDSNLFVGSTVKPLYSQYEKYSAFGLAFDAGIRYIKPEKGFSGSLVIRNLGAQIKPFHNTREPLPFEIILGMSKKLKHAPFKVYLTLHHMEQPKLIFDSKEEEEVTPVAGMEETSEQTKIQEYSDYFLRHVNLGIEFLPLKNFAFRIGYNHQRRQEMRIDDKGGMVGFSWGFGLKLSRFYVNYGRATYHLAGANNVISISTSLKE